jgi:GMP synthase (glutamine-hydrolysing)
MPVVLLPIVNKQGDECVVLRPIVSQEAMTARFVSLKPETLAAIVEKAKGIKGIGDLFIDVTHKPPATIEWE